MEFLAICLQPTLNDEQLALFAGLVQEWRTRKKFGTRTGFLLKTQSEEKELCKIPDCSGITQILNLNQALKDGKSPVQLVQMPAVIVERSSRRPGARGRIKSLNDNFIQSFQNKAPFFSWC